ncbi:MAG: IMP dehydrogenase, partial [Kiloniellaceae bacterium]
MKLRQALTFDDVLLEPAESAVLPSQTDTRTRLTRSIELGIPLVSSAMDTVTEGRLAIALAQAGGIGVIHKNLSIEEQADEVRRVKKFESGMVVNPVTIHPDEPLANALALMERHKISGIPVVERKTKKLVGVLTNRDVRFAENPKEPVSALMTRERLITVKEGVSKEEAQRLLHQHRIEKLLVVETAHGHSKGVISAVSQVKRLSKAAGVIAGNVATAEGARALVGAGADGVKVGIGPGSICTT